mmetsp:Transcript_48129/g.146370  ORF Transcript_48129/g.146370 Transcript_48129/m.146370 type:complete len:136 (-) Transcript_48129:33-440(-)
MGLTQSMLCWNSKEGDIVYTQEQAQMFDCLGEWETEKGVYRLSQSEKGGYLVFTEDWPPKHKLEGILRPGSGGWWGAEIMDKNDNDAVFGYLRMQPEGSGLRTSFRKSPTHQWDPQGLFAKRRVVDIDAEKPRDV